MNTTAKRGSPRDQSTSNLSGANFRHVENDDGRDETDTETGDDTTDDDGGETFSSEHLDDDSDEVDGTTGDDSGPSSDHVGGVTGDEGTKEGTGRQDRDDERGLGSADLFGADTLDSIDEDSGRQDSYKGRASKVPGTMSAMRFDAI